MTAPRAAQGSLYRHGRGLPADLVLAMKWSRLAADAGDRTAANLASELASSMNGGEVAETERRAADWEASRNR